MRARPASPVGVYSPAFPRIRSGVRRGSPSPGNPASGMPGLGPRVTIPRARNHVPRAPGTFGATFPATHSRRSLAASYERSRGHGRIACRCSFDRTAPLPRNRLATRGFLQRTPRTWRAAQIRLRRCFSITLSMRGLEGGSSESAAVPSASIFSINVNASAKSLRRKGCG
jgi:hypothetical protein